MGKSLKGKELGMGIFQRSEDGLYVGKFINRFGKRQTVYGKSVSEVSTKLRKAQNQDENEENVVDGKINLDKWFDIWMDTCKKNCRNSTRRTYTIQYNRLRGELGHCKLKSLNLITIQRTFNKMKSDKSRHDSRAVLVDMLNCAVKADLLVKNPALDVITKIDHKEPMERRVLSDKEIELLSEVMRKDGYMYPIMLVALNTGMRIGEVLGLCWDNVDFSNNLIHVRNTLVYLPNKGKGLYEFHDTKSKAGRRDIPMTKEVKRVLLKQKMKKSQIDARHNAREGFEDLVFVSKCNRPIHESNVRKSIKHYVDVINAKYPERKMQYFTPHSWRHTYASKCIAVGMKPKTLQKLLGHTTLQMTMDLYCHVSDDTAKEEMSLFAEMA